MGLRTEGMPGTYHIELRQFPHNFCHFNLSEQQLRRIVEPWVAGESVELGERKWDPHRAKLTILEGPQIPNGKLTMGRGWSVAQREGQDITRRLLVRPKEQRHPAELPATDSPSAASLADSLALEVLASLRDAPATLSDAWRLAAARSPRSSAEQSLALAEQALRSLLRSRLIVLMPPHSASPGRHSGGDDGVDEDQLEELMRAVDSWTGDGTSSGIRVRRA
jgi:hypothetical protein